MMSLRFQLAHMVLGISVLQAARGDSLAYTYTNLDFPGTAWGLNDAGQIVGGSSLYSQGQVTTITIPGELTGFTGINNAGQIVGTSGGLGGSNGFLYSNGALVHKSADRHFQEGGRVRIDLLSEDTDALASQRRATLPVPESEVSGKELARV